MRLYLVNPDNPVVSLNKVHWNRLNTYRVWKPLGRLVVAETHSAGVGGDTTVAGPSPISRQSRRVSPVLLGIIRRSSGRPAAGHLPGTAKPLGRPESCQLTICATARSWLTAAPCPKGQCIEPET
jgi:hypothetical protein